MIIDDDEDDVLTITCRTNERGT